MLISHRGRGVVRRSIGLACVLVCALSPALDLSNQRFVGRWRVRSESRSAFGKVISIRRERQSFVGTIEAEPGRRFEFRDASHSKLVGSYLVGGRSSRAVAQLTSANRVTLSIETAHGSTTRVALDRIAPNLRESLSPRYSRKQGYSSEEARRLVERVKEVATFIKELERKNKRACIDVSAEADNGYSMHIYEVVDDGDGMSHTATFGWYRVDRKTGKISPGM